MYTCAVRMIDSAAVIMAAAVSLDSAAAGFALGSGGIRIPTLSALIISIIGALFLSLPAALGELINGYIHADICRYGGKLLLAVLGIYALCKYFRKNSRRKYPFSECTDGSGADCADKNCDRRLNIPEAAVLAAGLSADSAVTGLSAGLTGLSGADSLIMFAFAALIGFGAVKLGHFAGCRISSAMKISAGWLSGCILLLLAVLM